ncbi:hypothetical protein SHIRM173S_01428 [Streptomyces hirsutus]
MVEYGRRLDHGRGASAADLFTEDGAWRSTTTTPSGGRSCVASSPAGTP